MAEGHGVRVNVGDIALCVWSSGTKKRVTLRAEGEVLSINLKRQTLRLKYVRTTIRGRDVSVTVKEATVPLANVHKSRPRAEGEHTDVRRSPLGAALLAGLK